MINLSIKQLESFLAVAASGGFRRAADDLHRSQSVISGHIQSLEDVLGVPLFHRTTRRVELSKEGLRLQKHALKALEELQDVVNRFKEEVELQRGRVLVSTSPSIASTCMPHLIAEFLGTHPGIRLQVEEAFAQTTLEAIANRDVDFGVGPLTDNDSRFLFEPLMEDDFNVLFPADYPLNGRTTVEFSEVCEHPVLCMPRTSGIRKLLEDIFLAHGKVLRPEYEVMHYHTLMGMVDAGLGLAIVPDIGIPASGYQHLQIARMVNPSIRRQICLITIKGDVLSPAAESFASLIREKLPQAALFKKERQTARDSKK